MTPRDLQHATKRYEQRRRSEDYRAGIITAFLANMSTGQNKKHRAFLPADFFPSLQDEDYEPIPAAITPGSPEHSAMIQSKLMGIHAALGGVTLTPNGQEGGNGGSN